MQSHFSLPFSLCGAVPFSTEQHQLTRTYCYSRVINTIAEHIHYHVKTVEIFWAQWMPSLPSMTNMSGSPRKIRAQLSIVLLSGHDSNTTRASISVLSDASYTIRAAPAAEKAKQTSRFADSCSNYPYYQLNRIALLVRQQMPIRQSEH